MAKRSKPRTKWGRVGAPGSAKRKAWCKKIGRKGGKKSRR